jgi:hypothetical protein
MQERIGAPLTWTVQASALGDAAAVLRAGQPELLAQHPEQRRVRIDVDVLGFPIDG